MNDIRRLEPMDKEWTLAMAGRAYRAFGFDYADTGQFFDMVTHDKDCLCLRTDNAFIFAMVQPRHCNFKIKECFVDLIACEGSHFEAIRLIKECVKWARNNGVEDCITMASRTAFTLEGIAKRVGGKSRVVYDIPIRTEH